ncbi:hypothetical protein SCLCIDRAFT_1220657 [Scleroderma citrinum Foug A]|uniref:Uncharacterized protein n=1 Tax=Scleroderma citrinum Foug A TaxID=1036808 RepID=A0A0C3DIV6_9AGAM|nr:hypothetical protein SCLCIDRAFT_1220657 [Scleroderma citrinum Foug A]
MTPGSTVRVIEDLSGQNLYCGSNSTILQGHPANPLPHTWVPIMTGYELCFV